MSRPKLRDGLRPRRVPGGRLTTLLCVICLLIWAHVQAGEVLSFDLQPSGDGYRLKTIGRIEATREQVWRVLSDYAALHRVSPRILESELVEVSADGVARVRTLNRLCFLAFCRNLRHVQLIRALGSSDFESHSVAAESDLSRGYARWRLHEQSGATDLEIDFSFAMDSDSWLPSFVTRFVARAALKSDAQELIMGIERVARASTAGLSL